MSADQLDDATEITEAYLASAIDNARKTKDGSRLPPRGTCHNCDEKLVVKGQLFCDAECSEDYEYVHARKTANRRII